MAECLNAMGFYSAAGVPFTTPIVSSLCRRLRSDGIDLSGNATLDPSGESQDLWSLTDLAERLEIKRETLSTWRRRGWVNADRNGQRWLFRVNASELNRLKKLAEYKRKALHKTPAELTTPQTTKGRNEPLNNNKQP